MAECFALSTLIFLIMIKLTPRLDAVAGMVNNCDTFLDVGTDHAYLSAYIVKNKIANRAIASDINPNPLMNAQKTLDEYSLADKITLRLSAGFENIEPYEAQEIAVAGMGGIMIADMINATEWLRDEKIHLILQPMTHFEDVWRALFDNGFLIEAEKTVCEDKRVYLIISARYSGVKTEHKLYEYYVGDLPKSDNETDKLFVGKVLKSLYNKYNGTKDEKILELIRSIENA